MKPIDFRGIETIRDIGIRETKRCFGRSSDIKGYRRMDYPMNFTIRAHRRVGLGQGGKHRAGDTCNFDWDGDARN